MCIRETGEETDPDHARPIGRVRASLLPAVFVVEDADVATIDDSHALKGNISFV
jgi:hypothetical protein